MSLNTSWTGDLRFFFHLFLLNQQVQRKVRLRVKLIRPTIISLLSSENKKVEKAKLNCLKSRFTCKENGKTFTLFFCSWQCSDIYNSLFHAQWLYVYCSTLTFSSELIYLYIASFESACNTNERICSTSKIYLTIWKMPLMVFLIKHSELANYSSGTCSFVGFIHNGSCSALIKSAFLRNSEKAIAQIYSTWTVRRKIKTKFLIKFRLLSLPFWSIRNFL